MKSEEKIKEKITKMEENLKRYKEDWNNLEKFVSPSGYKKIDDDLIYVSIVNQITALKWVLRDR